MDQKVSDVDLISQLPDHIIHRILSFLRCRKDVTRISILSKRWRDIWSSFLTLEFDQSGFLKKQKKLPKRLRRQYLEAVKKGEMAIGERTEIFRNFVDDILRSRIEQSFSIRKCIFHLISYDMKLGMDMDRWLGLVSESSMQELDLYVPSRKNGCYRVPQTIFSAKRIAALRIFGCKFDECKDIKFSNLQKLCLGKLHIGDNTMQNLLLSCPLIEDLRLVYCRGLKSLFSSSSNLIRVDLHLCHALKKVELQAPSLQMFCYHGDKYLACEIHLEMCTSLKSLTLEAARMEDNSLQNLLSDFPVLEQLTLSKCYGLKRFMISSHSLKTLSLNECKNLKEADIDTPNLLSFAYEGAEIPLFTLIPTVFMEAKFTLQCAPHPQFQLLESDRSISIVLLVQLQRFVKKFDKDLKLIVHSKKNVILCEDLDKWSLPPVKDFTLEFVDSSISLEDVIDRLLSTRRPVTLSTVSSTNSNFSKRVYLRMLDREAKPSCCRYNTSNKKCWRHSLKDVAIQNLANHPEDSDWFGFLKHLSGVNQISCYELNWGRAEKNLDEEEFLIGSDFVE